jgi:hypothetical protein
MKQEEKLYAIVGGIIILFILYITFYLMKQNEGLANKKNSPNITEVQARLDKINNDLTSQLQNVDDGEVLSLLESIKTNIILNNVNDIISDNKNKTKYTVSDITSIEEYLNTHANK